MEELVLENEYEIFVPLFGAAFAAPNKGTSILYWIRSLPTVLSSTEIGRIQGLSKPLSDFPLLFKADLIFKDFSSLCEPCICSIYKNQNKKKNPKQTTKLTIIWFNTIITIKPICVCETLCHPEYMLSIV